MSKEVYWYLRWDREGRDRERMAIFAVGLGFIFIGVSLVVRSASKLAVSMAFDLETTLGILAGIAMIIFAISQVYAVIVRTEDIRADDQGLFVQRGLTRQQHFIPYEALDFDKRRTSRRWSSIKMNPLESRSFRWLQVEMFTIIPVRGLQDVMRSIVGFEHGFGFKPVIIVSQFHENSAELLERISAHQTQL